jgi:predicted lipoprotein with Yx(FWY)xxD motif
VTAVAVVATACGGARVAVPNGGAPTTGPQGPGYMVHTGTVKSLGTVLVDGYDETLYLFVPDGGRGRSTCVGTCAAKWPPLVLPAGVAHPFIGPGAVAALVGTTRRADGGLQVTYGGWPLYHWIGDTTAGEATGEGLVDSGGQWFAVDAQGQAVH